MKNFLLSLITPMMLLNSAASAEVVYPVKHQTERFTQRLNRIQSAVNGVINLPTTDEKISALDWSGAREALTELQNIIRIYQDGKPYESLEQYYEVAKKFEDLISHMRDLKWFADQAENSGNEQAAQKYAQLLREKSLEYDVFIKDSGWFSKENPMSAQIKTTLDQIKWPSLEKDRDYLLKRMAKRMGKIHAKEFDVKQVELGIHELKRDARRLFYLDRSIGLIRQDMNRTCPIGQEPAKETRKPVESFQCPISYCLTQKLQNAQYQLDSIKMDGLDYELRGEHVPESVTKAAQVILDDLKGSKVFLHLEAQLSGCRPPGSEEDDKKEEDKADGNDQKDPKPEQVINIFGGGIQQVPPQEAPKFAVVPTQKKFSDFLAKIEAEIVKYEGNAENVDALATGTVRQALFSIQSLAELYKKQYPSLNEVWRTTKSLEDTIGKYRQALEQYDYAVDKGAPPEKIKELENAKVLQKANLIRFLDTAEWNSGKAVARLKEILSKTAWKSDAEEQNYTYLALAARVQGIDETDWNMEVLEGGGIHDLRKAVRWYKLEMTALSDMVTFQNQKCGQPNPPIANGKCVISECHNSQMTEIYSLFGTIKDIGEGQHGVGGEVPQELMDQAAALYNQTREKQTFTKLTEEFKFCAAAAVANDKK